MAEPANPTALLAALRLALVPGIGPRWQQALYERFGSAEAFWQSDERAWRELPGIGPKLAANLRDAKTNRRAEEEMARCQSLGVTLLPRSGPDYPVALGSICDPPGILYCHGALTPSDGLCVSIVGSRRCTLYGRQQAERLASALARAGVTVVSGLARGIDAAAHEGALAAAGRTLAVLGTGLANIYPPEHQGLADRIVKQGALLSEMPLDQAPLPGLFPQRNRLISGLSQGVIIVEAARNSGALHTARHAMEQGREVFAVPGRVDSLASEGCHDLIRDGAVLVRNPDDVLQSLGPLVKPVRTPQGTVVAPRELMLNAQERQVLELVGLEPRHIDDVLRSAELPHHQVLATLTVLEMKRLVQRLPGGNLCRWAPSVR